MINGIIYCMDMEKTVSVPLFDVRGASAEQRKEPEDAIEIHCDIERHRAVLNQANLLRSNLGLSPVDEANLHKKVLSELEGITDLKERFAFLIDSEYTSSLYALNLSSMLYSDNTPPAAYDAQSQEYRDLCAEVGLDSMIGRDDKRSGLSFGVTPFVSPNGNRMAIFDRSRRVMSRHYEGLGEVRIRERMGVLALDLTQMESYRPSSSLDAIAEGIDGILDKIGVNSLIENLGLPVLRTMMLEADRRPRANVTYEDLHKLFDDAHGDDTERAVIISRVFYGYIERSANPPIRLA